MTDPTDRDRARGARDTSRDPANDPTAVRAQPALTTSTGTVWLVVGGVFTAISLAMLLALSTLPGGGVALAAAVIVAILYVAMLVARTAVPAGRRRLRVLAVGMLLIAAVALGGVMIVAATAWDGIPR
jgi:hypothetical protein